MRELWESSGLFLAERDAIMKPVSSVDSEINPRSGEKNGKRFS